MSKTMLTMTLAAAALLALPLACGAEPGPEDAAQVAAGGHAGGHAGGAEGAPAPASLAGSWAALRAARDAIAADIESGALGEIHAKAEPLPELAEGLLANSADLEASRRARVEGAVKQMARVAGALHVAADRADAGRTREELSRLDGLLELIRGQYPTGALEAETGGHGEHGAADPHPR